MGMRGSGLSNRGGLGVFVVGFVGCGRALLPLRDAVLSPPSRIDLTLSNRPGLVTEAAVSPGLWVWMLDAVTDFVNPPRVVFDGDLIRDFAGVPFPAAMRAMDDFVGVITDAMVMDRGIMDEYLTAVVGRGKKLASRETGRLLDASSSMCCLARLAAETGSASSMRLDRFWVDRGSWLKGGLIFLRDEAGHVSLGWAGSGRSSRLALD